MARPIWKGHIAFGLVSIPVTLFSAEQRNELRFHMIDSRNRARVRYNRVNEESGEEVPNESIVRGYEYDKNQYVLLNDDDFKKVDVEATKRIDIEDFVDASQIPPLYFDKPYYLEPAKAGEKGYALLRETLKLQNKVGIAKVVLRSREYLAALMPIGDLLVLEMLRFAHELRKPEEFSAPSANDKNMKMSQREIDMAVQLVEAMAADWEPEKYKDDYRDRVLDYIDQKVKAGELEPGAGPEPEVEEEEPQERVVNLMDYLKQSVEAAKKRREQETDSKSKKEDSKPAARKTVKKRPRRTASKTARKRQTA